MLRTLIASTALALLASVALAEEAAKNPLMEEGFFTDKTTVAEVQALFDKGFGVDERDRYGKNPLHLAIDGHAPLEVLQLLIDKGAAVNQPEGKKGELVTHFAAYAGDIEVLKLVDAAGANWLVADDVKETALHWATYNNNLTPEMVEFLLAEGIDPAAQNQTGDTAAMSMAWSEAENAGEIYDLLLAKGSPDLGFNADGEDSFMKAITWSGKGAWLERLYEQSEDPFAANNEGMSGIILASKWGVNKERLEFLKTHDFDIFVENSKGENAMILNAAHGDLEILALLLAEGFDVNSESDTGKTPLLEAFRFKDDYQPAAVTALIEAGADVTHADAKGVTALMKFLEGHIEDPASEDGVAKLALFDVLLSKGADLKGVDAGGATTLIYAVKGGQSIDLLKTILAAGVDVNAKDGDGMTALMYAASLSKDPAVLELLLDAGADTGVKDVFDDGAAAYAADNKALTGAAVLARL
jgi:ankyrin repeat protein